MSIYSNRDRYIDEMLEAQQRELEELRKEPEDQKDNPDYIPRFEPEPQRYTAKETLYIIWGAVGSGLLIAGIFIVGAFLFLLFCTQIWLK